MKGTETTPGTYVGYKYYSKSGDKCQSSTLTSLLYSKANGCTAVVVNGSVITDYYKLSCTIGGSFTVGYYPITDSTCTGLPNYAYSVPLNTCQSSAQSPVYDCATDATVLSKFNNVKGVVSKWDNYMNILYLISIYNFLNSWKGCTLTLKAVRVPTFLLWIRFTTLRSFFLSTITTCINASRTTKRTQLFAMAKQASSSFAILKQTAKARPTKWIQWPYRCARNPNLPLSTRRGAALVLLICRHRFKQSMQIAVLWFNDIRF